MSLVRHLVSPPSDRAAADTAELAFDLSVDPDPLRVSPSSGAPALGGLIIVASLASTAPVECRSFTVVLRVGPDGEDLLSSLTDVTPLISWPDWEGTVDTAASSITFAPKAGSFPYADFRPSSGVTFQVRGMPINQCVGVSPVAITASCRPRGTLEWRDQNTVREVGKFPLGFHLRSFTADPPSVLQGGSIVLSWDASAATSLTLHYDGQTHPVTGKTCVRIDDVQQTSYFHLRAAAQEGTGTVERTLSVMVQVPDPELKVGRIIVHGILQTPQITSLTSPTTPVALPQQPPVLPRMRADIPAGGWVPQYPRWGALPPPGAFAVAQGETLHTVYRPAGGSGLALSTYDGHRWSRVEEPLPAGSHDGSLAIQPGTESGEDILWCAYRDSAGQVKISKRDDSGWHPYEPAVSAETNFRPALAVNGGWLFLVFVRRSDNAALYMMKRIGDRLWSGPHHFHWPTASGAPAVMAHGHHVRCVFPNGSYFVSVRTDRVHHAHPVSWEGSTVSGVPAPGGGLSLTAADKVYCAYRDTAGRPRLVELGFDRLIPLESDRVYSHDPTLLAYRGGLWLT